MTNNGSIARLEAKTPEQRFVRMLEQEFEFAPKIAQVILEEAQASLLGSPGESLRPGQVRVILTKRDAGHGRALRETETTEVTWTADAGAEDQQIRQRHGQQALRRVRIQRLLLEALEQDAVATQEDLARMLNASLRTIKRDCAALQAQGIYLPTRGNVHGIGRGQTHKAQIIGRWLRGETYDQIAMHTQSSSSFHSALSSDFHPLGSVTSPRVQPKPNWYVVTDQPHTGSRIPGCLPSTRHPGLPGTPARPATPPGCSVSG